VRYHSSHQRVLHLYDRQLEHQRVRIVILVSSPPIAQKTTPLEVMSLMSLCTRDIPLVAMAYLGWKYVHKTEIIGLTRIPLQEALDQADKQAPDEPRPSSESI
jgi:hypothetical protein